MYGINYLIHGNECNENIRHVLVPIGESDMPVVSEWMQGMTPPIEGFVPTQWLIAEGECEGVGIVVDVYVLDANNMSPQDWDIPYNMHESVNGITYEMVVENPTVPSSPLDEHMIGNESYGDE
jgi:hypothetical protein